MLHNLNFTFKKGKITTILGANGCGKSTLFRLMSKDLKPQAGRITLDGTDIAQIPLRDFARQTAILHQGNTAPSDLTVRKLVSYGRIPHRHFGTDMDSEDAIIMQALEDTALTACAEQTLSTLSGGQRQRAFLAMTLAQQPRVLLLDEPTTYLDLRCQLDLLRLVRHLNETQRLTIVMILHDVNQSLHHSDEILALSPQGELLAQGAPEKIISPELLEAIYSTTLELAQVHGKPFVLTV